jgi:hypothetical protein
MKKTSLITAINIALLLRNTGLGMLLVDVSVALLQDHRAVADIELRQARSERNAARLAAELRAARDAQGNYVAAPAASDWQRSQDAVDALLLAEVVELKLDFNALADFMLGEKHVPKPSRTTKL